MNVRQMISAGIVLVSVTACTGNNITDIEDISIKPTKYIGEAVTVRGTVSYAAGISGYGTYTVTDKTGSIIIITSRGIPKNNSKLDEVTGVVYQPVAFGNNSVLLILQGDVSFEDIINLLLENKAVAAINKKFNSPVSSSHSD